LAAARTHTSRPWILACLLALLGATLAVRLFVALADHRSLIGLDIYQDDAFYYLKLAQNLIEGRGLTFDGVTATNGFHPLYLILLLPILAVSGGEPIAPIHASAILLSAAAVLTGWLVFRLTRRLAGAAAGLIALAVWALSPYFTVLGINGLETGLAMLFAVAALYAYLEWVRLADGAPSSGRAAALGAVFGLAVLARIDLLLLLGAIGLDWLAVASRRGPVRFALPRIAITAAVALAVWLPWGTVSRVQTGAWLPASGAATRQIALSYGWIDLPPVWSAELRPPGGDPYFDFDRVPAAYFADAATHQLFVFLLEHPLLAALRLHLPYSVWPRLERYPPHAAFTRSPWLGAGLAALCLAAVIAGIRRIPAGSREVAGFGGVAGLHLLLVFLAYTFYCPAHWYYSRYLIPAVLLTLVAGICALHAMLLPLWRRGGGARAGVLAGILLLVGGQIAIIPGSTLARVRWSGAEPGGFLRGWRSLEDRIPASAKLGAFQAGVFSWFGQRDVVNLDGKVNPDAARALASRELGAYIESRGVDYILDWPWILHSLCTRHLRPGDPAFREIAREPPGGTGFALYRVEPSSLARGGDRRTGER
jgi:4-amino-4-deoxy-L-arabinose transferase-like glycosyltransferase